MPVRPLMDVPPRRRPQENLLVLGEACTRTSIKDKPAKLSAQSLTLGFLEVYRNFRIFKECRSVDVSDTITRPLQDAQEACTQQALQTSRPGCKLRTVRTLQQLQIVACACQRSPAAAGPGPFRVQLCLKQARP